MNGGQNLAPTDFDHPGTFMANHNDGCHGTDLDEGKAATQIGSVVFS